MKKDIKTYVASVHFYETTALVRSYETDDQERPLEYCSRWLTQPDLGRKSQYQKMGRTL